MLITFVAVFLGQEMTSENTFNDCVCVVLQYIQYLQRLFTHTLKRTAKCTVYVCDICVCVFECMRVRIQVLAAVCVCVCVYMCVNTIGLGVGTGLWSMFMVPHQWSCQSE